MGSTIMLSHLPSLPGSLAFKGPSTNHRHPPKAMPNYPTSNGSVSSIPPFLARRRPMAPSYSETGVSNSQLETLHELSDPRDQSYCAGYNRPTSISTVNSSYTTTTSVTSPANTQQDEEIYANLACQPIAVSSDTVQPSPQGGSHILVRSISGPHPVIRSRSATENYSRPRAAPQPRSNSAVRIPQLRLLEKHRQLQSTPPEKRPATQQLSSRLSQQQQPPHPLVARPQITPVKNAFPRKLHLLTRSVSQSYMSSPPPDALSQAVPQDGPLRSHPLFNYPGQSFIKMKTSLPSVRPSSYIRRPETMFVRSKTPEHNTHCSRPSPAALPPSRRSQHETLVENLQPILSHPQSNVSQETCPSVQNTSTSSLSTNSKSTHSKSTHSKSTNSKSRRLTLKGISESKPSLDCSTRTSQQKHRVRPDSASSSHHRSSMHTTVAAKHKSLVTAGDGEKAAPAQTLIRKESPEELIKCLEKLIGYDELRLLVSVDKLLLRSKDPEHRSISGHLAQDLLNLSRKSSGSGILGRFGWKQRKPVTLVSSVKNKQRNEVSNNDRRATFGFWGASSTRSPRVGVFSSPLEDSDPFSCVTVIGGQKHLIPTVMFCLIEEIFVRGMETPGVMRIAGKVEQVDSLAEAFERPPHYGDGIDLSNEDIHVLCSLFKRYLRSLPEPLMSRDLFHILWSHCIRPRKGHRAQDLQNKVATAQCLMRLTPPRSFSLLIYVLAFLAQIPLFPRNKFSSIGIAKIFGPALFGTRTQRNAALDERSIEALKWILENWNMIADGLLDEYFVPQITGSSSPPGSSSPGSRSPPVDCVSASHSSQPSLIQPSQEASHLSQETMPSSSMLSLEFPTVEPAIPASASMSFIPFKSLRGYHSQSLRRDSLRSAQYIVDCYEAHEKTIIDGKSVNRRSDGAELRNPEDWAITPTRKATPVGPDQQTGQFDGLGIGDFPEGMASMKADVADLHTLNALELSNSKRLNDGGLRCNDLSQSPKRRLLVLNEPLDPPPVPSKRHDIDPNLTVSLIHNTARVNESVPPDDSNAKSTNKPRGPNPSVQVLSLSGIFSLEKLGLNMNPDLNADEDRAKRIVQKSIEIVDKHQQLLLELKQQLYSMLTEDFKSTRCL